MEIPALSKEAKALMRRVLDTEPPEDVEGVVLCGLRAALFRLGWMEGERIREVAEVPPGRAPWEWLPERAEEGGLGSRFPYRKVLQLAGELCGEEDRWIIGREELILAVLGASGIPLREPFAGRVLRAARGETGAPEAGEDEVMSVEEQLAAIFEEERRGLRDASGPECPELEKLARDLTREAAEGRLPPVAGREHEIDAVLETLCRVTKRNPLLVGPPGCGKTAVAAGVARRIVSGRVPEPLAGARLMAISAGDLVAGMKYVGSLEERMAQVIEEASQPGIVLFIDEIHLAVGSGASSKSDQDVANLLKPALADGRIAVIGATTDVEVERLVKDPAFERRFRTIPVEELGRDAALVALRSRAAFIQERTGVEVGDRAVVLAANLADRLIRHRVRPDKGIDVLEQAAARAQMRGARTVEPELVREVVREMIGMPFRPAELRGRLRLVREVLEGLGLLDAEAAGRLADRLQVTMLGLDVRPLRPNAVILVAGRREAGEELARVISEVLLEREEIVEIDLREVEAAGGLRGPGGGEWKAAPPRYQRQLTSRPWSVVLATGLEDAPREVLDALADAMERGYMVGAHGRRVPLADAVFVLVRGEEATRPVGFGGAAPQEEAPAAATEAARFLGPRLAPLVDFVCRPAGVSTLPKERWIRSRLLAPVAERWERELGVRVRFGAGIAAALARAAARDGLGREELGRLFESRVVAPVAPALEGTPAGVVLTVELVSEDPLTVSWSPAGVPAAAGPGSADP